MPSLIPAHRFIKQKTDEILSMFRHDPNDALTRHTVTRTLTGHLSKSGIDSTVFCDEMNNTQTIINNNQICVDIIFTNQTIPPFHYVY